MSPGEIRPEEGFGTEGFGTEGLVQTEGIGYMEGPERPAAAKAAAAPAAPKKTVRSAMPGMRSAVVWAEILGKPRALRKR